MEISKDKNILKFLKTDVRNLTVSVKTGLTGKNVFSIQYDGYSNSTSISEDLSGYMRFNKNSADISRFLVDEVITSDRVVSLDTAIVIPKNDKQFKSVQATTESNKKVTLIYEDKSDVIDILADLISKQRMDTIKLFNQLLGSDLIEHLVIQGFNQSTNSYRYVAIPDDVDLCFNNIHTNPLTIKDNTFIYSFDYEKYAFYKDSVDCILDSYVNKYQDRFNSIKDDDSSLIIDGTDDLSVQLIGEQFINSSGIEIFINKMNGIIKENAMKKEK